MAYVSWMIVLTAGCCIAGWQFGKHHSPKHFRRTALMLGLAGAMWILLSVASRWYADSYLQGWELAADFAHTGRYILLAALLSFGFCLALRAETDSVPRSRLFTSILVLVLGIGIIIFKSMPAYVFLDEGARDEDGFLKQTRDQEYTCAPVCLGNYLEVFKKDAPQSERDLAKACGTTIDGTTATGLIRGCWKYGLTNAHYTFVDYDDLVSGPMPAVVMLSTVPGMRHASLLVGTADTHLFFIDPAYGAWQIKIDLFKSAWYGPVIYFE